MKLPTSIKIGKTRFDVLKFIAMGRGLGFMRPQVQQIHVATSTFRSPVEGLRVRDAEDIAETFWHEVTHAILHDMDHPLWKDETFVTAFSKRLSKAISSARFE